MSTKKDSLDRIATKEDFARLEAKIDALGDRLCLQFLCIAAVLVALTFAAARFL